MIKPVTPARSRTAPAFRPPASRPARVLVARPAPEVDGGRYAPKFTLGDRAELSADVIRDGHEVLRAELVVSPPSGSAHTVPMAHVDADSLGVRWAASVELDQLGPFGAGNRRPVFATENARLVGNPQLDARGADLRIRVTHEGQVVAARLRGGARLFESMRTLRDPVTLIHSPRIVSRAEEGPVELQVWRVHHAC